MSIFKCKMCGGTIEFEPGATVGVCDSCGTKQTLPRLDDDRRANLYDRANHFRRNNDFDKAAGLYEQILNEDTTDAEAYWSLVLCRYGVEYVEDPATHLRVPTVNRTQFTSIFDDDNYRSALKYADGVQRGLYEQEAAAINEIQKGILAISEKEEPFDVFICYKEADDSGRRTVDSVLANDLYHQLTQEGFKVFFARITLEDKLGSAYEPYIFAALNSAKVMVVLGTKPEYFNAVWVKNEWSRYLKLIKAGAKKTLIPAYRDMDPYDLPEEFSHLMAQDMSKLGFMQDLIRGIKKICRSEEAKTPAGTVAPVQTGGAGAEPLLKRAFMFLEDGSFQDADEYCERVLDQDPENARAYLGKLMAEQRCRRQEDLADCPEPFDASSNYRKALRFGDEKLAAALTAYIEHIRSRNENARLTGIYDRASAAMESADSEQAYKDAAELFGTAPGFQDADELAGRCLEKAEECRKDAVYAAAKAKMTGSRAESYEEAIAAFGTIPGWKDAEDQIGACRSRIAEIRRKEEQAHLAAQAAAKRTKRILSVVLPVLAVLIALGIVYAKVILPKQKYDRALGYINNGDYESAYPLLDGLNYKDSAEKRVEIKQAVLSKAKVGDYVAFGAYEQDNNAANGKEEVEWLVLAKENNRVLLLSRYALDCKPYNTKYTAVTWETCSLRTWLNGSFLNDAFTVAEQALIPTVTVSADKNPEYNTNPGNSTQDRVFLLSIPEANRYFSTDEARKCAPTDYAIAQGAYASDKYKADGRAACWWWLRSPGGSSSLAADVDLVGSVSTDGGLVNYDFGAVRPALWIDLGS